MKTNLHQLNSFYRSTFLFGRKQVWYHALRIKETRGLSDLSLSRSSLHSEISHDCPPIYLGFTYRDFDGFALKIIENDKGNILWLLDLDDERSERPLVFLFEAHDAILASCQK